MKIGLVLLAAGTGGRFGGRKLEAVLNGRHIIEYILHNIPVNYFDEITIIAANQNILNTADKYGISGVINNQPDLQIAHSIKMGTQIIKDMDAYMYCVCDQPLLMESTIINMVSSYESGSILALSNNGKRGNPVIFPSSLYSELVALKPNESGRKVINNHLDILKLHEINDETQLLDIDTKKDYKSIKDIIRKKSF